MSGFKDFLNTYGGDGKISGKDAKAFASAGGTQAQLQKYLNKAQEGKGGFTGTVGGNAFKAADNAKHWSDSFSSGSSSSSGSTGGSGTGWGGYTEALFNQLGAETLATIQGQNMVDYANAVGAIMSLFNN